MPKQIKAWQCAHCRRYRKTKKSIVRHEEICFNNPDRKILDGELAIFDTMPRELIIVDNYGVPDSDWHEPDWTPNEELSNKYKWWPRDGDGELALGFVHTDGKWEKIPRYKPPHFAPGFTWRDEVVPKEFMIQRYSRLWDI